MEITLILAALGLGFASGFHCIGMCGPIALSLGLSKKQQVNFHCREGYCGACRCKLLSGEVRYITEPLAFVRSGEFLPCCSIPLTDIDIEIP